MPPHSISLTLDIRPCAKPRPRVTRWGAYNEPRYMEWRAEVVRQVKAQWDGVKISGKIGMFCHHDCKKKLRPDLDNAVGAVQDALKDAGIYGDDRIIRTLIVTCQEDTGRDRISLFLWTPV
mgnify:CR=1 FL=1